MTHESQGHSQHSGEAATSSFEIAAMKDTILSHETTIARLREALEKMPCLCESPCSTECPRLIAIAALSAPPTPGLRAMVVEALKDALTEINGWRKECDEQRVRGGCDAYYNGNQPELPTKALTALGEKL